MSIADRDLHFGDFRTVTFEEWRAVADAAPTSTPEGIALEPLYPIACPLAGETAREWPGQARYRRGGRAAGHLAAGWSVEQRAAAPTAEAFNRALRGDLEAGVTAARVPLVDAAGADGWPGATWRAGSADDVERALRGVDLARVPVVLQTTGSGQAPLEWLLTVAERRRVAPEAIRGGVEADPLSGLVRRGRLAAEPAHLLDDLARTVERVEGACAPTFTALGVSGLPYVDGGADAVQEVALILASGAEMLAALQARGVAADAAAPRTVVTVSLGGHLLMEIARLRALRLLWARMVEAFGGDEPAQRVRVRGSSARWGRTAAEPALNAVRATFEGFAAVVGQVDALELLPFDALSESVPSERARRLARNTQLVLLHEAHLTRVIDPVGGSAAVEALTDEVARRGWALFQQIEGEGGIMAALERGLPQRWVAERARERRAALATGRSVVVGVNHQADLAQPVVVSPDAVPPAGEALGDPAPEVPADTGDGLRVEPIVPARASEPFEGLRRRAAALASATGAPLRAALVGVGAPAEVRPRMDFCRDALAVGGFETGEGTVVADGEALGPLLAGWGEPIVVLCPPPAAEPAAQAELVARTRAARPHALVVLAGRSTAGDASLYRGADLVAVLSGLLDRLGARPEEPR